jgi:hypothetical protein
MKAEHFEIAVVGGGKGGKTPPAARSPWLRRGWLAAAESASPRHD